MRKKKRMSREGVMAVTFAGLLCISLVGNAVMSARAQEARARLIAQHQRELAEVVGAMADIEVNLHKLLIAGSAEQSATLLGQTALLSQQVQMSLSRLPLGEETSGDTMKFAGQMEEYAMTLAARVSGGRMLTTGDEQQINSLIEACRALGGHLSQLTSELVNEPERFAAVKRPERQTQDALTGDNAVPYPTLIYDGPFSDGRSDAAPKALGDVRVSRETAREAAAKYAGTTADQVQDEADSGGRFEAFGFIAQTRNGAINVQVTGQGGRLLFMMPEKAEYEEKKSWEECLQNARVWLADMGFGEMEPCFVQNYDGMTVANFAAVQEGVRLYPDQVKVQISMETGNVVGAECSQYLTNHEKRKDLIPKVSAEEAQEMVSGRLAITNLRLCVIPKNETERFCWEFEGTADEITYYVYIDAQTGEPAEILQLVHTQDGEAAL